MKTRIRNIFMTVCLVLASVAAQAQILEPVKFKMELNKQDDGTAEVVFTAKIDPGWHVYSTDLGDGGPISASFHAEKLEGCELVGTLKSVGKEVEAYDKLFDMQVRYFEGEAQFVQELKLTAEDYVIEGYLEYGACNDENCLPPTQVPFSYGERPAGGDSPVIGGADGQTSIAVTDGQPSYWAPVVDELNGFGETVAQRDLSWLYVFGMGFVGGLLALFSPCVLPIIPMTVRFFLKRSKDRR